MDSDYGVPRELSEVQKKRALYQPEVPPCLQVRTALPIATDSLHCLRHCVPCGLLAPDLFSGGSRGARSRAALVPDRLVRSALMFTLHRSPTPDSLSRGQV